MGGLCNYSKGRGLVSGVAGVAVVQVSGGGKKINGSVIGAQRCRIRSDSETGERWMRWKRRKGRSGPKKLGRFGEKPRR